MRIAFQLMYWYPHEGPLQPIYGSLIDHLTARGHEVMIITSLPHFRAGSDDRPLPGMSRVFERGRWHDATVLRTWVLAPRYSSRLLTVPARGLNYLSFSGSGALASLLTAERPDVVVAPSSPPHLNGQLALAVTRLTGAKLLYNVQDMYPDFLAQSGLVRSRLVLGALERWESLVYRRAARTVVISPSMRDKVLARGGTEDRATIIPNHVDTESLRPLDGPSPYRERRPELAGKFVVLYAGNLGFSQGAGAILAAAERLADRDDVFFLCLGRGEKKDELEREARAKRLRNIAIMPFVPREEVSEVHAAADVCLVTLRPGIGGDVIPSKLQTILACGRPVIASVDDDCSVAAEVRRAGAGRVVSPGSPRAIADAIMEMKGAGEERREMGRRARDHAVRHLSLEVNGARWEELMTMVVGAA